MPVAAVLAAEVATEDPLGVRVRCAPPQWGACPARAGRRNTQFTALKYSRVMASKMGGSRPNRYAFPLHQP